MVWYSLFILVLAVVQLVWIYKAWKSGGFGLVINLVAFACLSGLISYSVDYKEQFRADLYGQQPIQNNE